MASCKMHASQVSFAPGDGEYVEKRTLSFVVVSGMLNHVFSMWTFCCSVIVLFLNELGLPKGKNDVLLSLFPFCGLLAMDFAPADTQPAPLPEGFSITLPESPGANGLDITYLGESQNV